MSNSLCPDCHSKNTYSYLNNRKCGDCDKAWLDKLDDNENVDSVSREHAMRIVSRKVSSSSITSKFTSLDRDVHLKKETNSPNVRTPKRSNKLARIKQLLKKNGTTEEGVSKKPVVVLKEIDDDDDDDDSIEGSHPKNIKYVEQQAIGTKGVGNATSTIGKHFPKTLGSTMLGMFSRHQEPEKTPDPEPKPKPKPKPESEPEPEPKPEPKPEPEPKPTCEPVEQKKFTFVWQKIRGAPTANKRPAIGSKRRRQVSKSSDGFMTPLSGATHKRARKDHFDTITDIGNTSTHMTDGPLPEMLPQPNLQSQPKNQHPQAMSNNIISGNNKTSEPILERRQTRLNPNGIARKPTISSATIEGDVQKSNNNKNKKKQILDDVESSADEYEYSGDDSDDDDGSFYDSDEDTNKLSAVARYNNGPSLDASKSSNNANMNQSIPSEQYNQQQAGLSDSDDPFSDQENEYEEMIEAPKFTSNVSKARAVNKNGNPYLNFFKMESEKIQAGRATKIPYLEMQQIVGQRYRALSNEEKIALGKIPSQIKRQNYLYSTKGPRPKKPARPKHVIELEKSRRKQRGYLPKNAYEGLIKFS